MRIFLITQNEPFYLKDNLEYLFSILPRKVKIVGCVVTNVSPFGRQKSFLNKAKETLSIFGLTFFIYYSLKFIYSKLFKASVNDLLKSKKIKIINIEGSINSSLSLNKIKNCNPDLLVSILGNQIFKRPLIDLAPKGCINLHTAFLPKYRGLMPSFWVLKNNENKTGVSVFFVDEGIDSGPIIIQNEISINNRSLEELIIFTKKIGMELISKAIKLIIEDNVKLIPNDDLKKTYYSFPTRKDVLEFNYKNKFFF